MVHPGATRVLQGMGHLVSLYVLRIEIDGHWRGSGNVPKPWVARIDGQDPKYGLARTFVERMNDWRDARKAWSGNKYGVVATWVLREGALYEICRARGRTSKRYMAREFRWCENGKLHSRTAEETLALVDGGSGSTTMVELPDEPSSFVSEVSGLGSPRRLGWVLDGKRQFRLLHGRVYEIREGEQNRLVTPTNGRLVALSPAQAWERLSA